MTSNNY